MSNEYNCTYYDFLDIGKHKSYLLKKICMIEFAKQTQKAKNK